MRHLLFDLDRSGMVQDYFESPPLVPPLAIFVALLQLLVEVLDPSRRVRDVV